MDIALMAAAVCLGIPLATAGVALFSENVQLHVPRLTIQNDSPGKAAFLTLILWAVMTAVGVTFAKTVAFYPTINSDKGQEIADAFRALTVLAVPVFSLVVSVLIYAVLRRGSGDHPTEDAEPVKSEHTWSNIWLGVTAGLTLLVIIYPGLTSLDKVIKTSSNPDLVVTVEGMQWTWLVGYPDQGVTNQRELTLPVNRTVNLLITSRDVIHSFWVPSFLMKADAVPGQTATVSLKTTKVGDYETDPQVRLQCAELCGLGHASMRIPVHVVSEQDWNNWLAEQRRSKQQ